MLLETFPAMPWPAVGDTLPQEAHSARHIFFWQSFRGTESLSFNPEVVSALHVQLFPLESFYPSHREAINNDPFNQCICTWFSLFWDFLLLFFFPVGLLYGKWLSQRQHVLKHCYSL